MIGYTNILRSITKGNGKFSMIYSKYKEVPTSIQNQILNIY